MRKVWIAVLFVAGALRFMVRRAVIPVRREETVWIDQEMEKVTLLFVSDVHNNRLVDSLETEEVDFIIIGGDFVDRRVSDAMMKRNLEVLKKMDKPIYFVPGNNDREKKWTFQILRDYNVRILSNETSEMENYSITGLDPYRPEGVSLPERSGKRPSILVIHDPYFINEWQEYSSHFDIVLSGHTHGGQLRFMDYGPYERGGWKNFEGGRVFVSEGYGTSLLPLRLETHSEYHLFTLQKKR